MAAPNIQGSHRSERPDRFGRPYADFTWCSAASFSRTVSISVMLWYRRPGFFRRQRMMIFAEGLGLLPQNSFQSGGKSLSTKGSPPTGHVIEESAE